MGWGPFDISGKNAIVTGGAMGIGFGIVERFLEGGANVIVADIDGEAAAAAARKLQGMAGRVESARADVSERQCGAMLVERCVEVFGSVDILVNNAGIYPQVPMLEIDPDLFERILKVNLKGAAFLSQAVAKQMISQGRGGRIINITSVDAFHPSMIGLAAYDSSKGGLTMFTKNFALEVAPHHITVNAIAPGGIHTEGASQPLEGSGMTQAQMDEMIEAFVARIPMHRFGDPDDIAKVAVFLASPASDYMTGTTVVVDGGMLLA